MRCRILDNAWEMKATLETDTEVVVLLLSSSLTYRNHGLDLGLTRVRERGRRISTTIFREKVCTLAKRSEVPRSAALILRELIIMPFVSHIRRYAWIILERRPRISWVFEDEYILFLVRLIIDYGHDNYEQRADLSDYNGGH